METATRFERASSDVGNRRSSIELRGPVELQTGFEPACADLEDRCLSARATGAWRPEPELNRHRRFCRALPDHSGHLVNWQPLSGLNRGHSLSESDALPLSYGASVVRVRGFEPLPSAFQVRSSAGLSYTLFELDPTTGFEPASSASVARCSSSELRGEIGAPCGIRTRDWPLDERRELAPAAGFEPASFSVNSRARSPRVLDRNIGGDSR